MNDIYEYLEEVIKENVTLSQDALQKDSCRFWSACTKEYELLCEKLNDQRSQEAFSLIINELLLQQLHSLLVAIDGGEWISERYQFDIVHKETGCVFNEKNALHEQFIDYLWEKRTGNPFENL